MKPNKNKRTYDYYHDQAEFYKELGRQKPPYSSNEIDASTISGELKINQEVKARDKRILLSIV